MKDKIKDALITVYSGIIFAALFATIVLWLLGFISVVPGVIVISIGIGSVVSWFVYYELHPEKKYKIIETRVEVERED